jgi:dipeptidase E
VDSEGRILALGGRALDPAVVRQVLDWTGAPAPRVVLLPTATGDDPRVVMAFHEVLGDLGLPGQHVLLHGVPRADWRDLVAAADAICVTGGNTANMLAVWRVHGMDAAVRAAHDRGAVLWGASAGMICWFECGVTDSFAPTLHALQDGLGIVAGSACPHYDGEPQRRPTYERLVASGELPAGLAADDGVGLELVGGALRGVVTAVDGSTAYRVEPDGAGGVRETALEARRIGG